MIDEPENENPDIEETEEAPAALIFGKYKTIEEAEKGYKELEREFHARHQAEAAEPAEDYGYVSQPAPATTSEGVVDPNEAFYENPAQFVVQTIAQIRQVERLAATNKRAAMRELKSHPQFGAVQDEVESVLEQMEPVYLVDPAQARQVVRAVFGERLVERTSKQERPREPAPVRPAVSDIEEPDSVGSEVDVAALDNEGEEILRSLGLSGKSRAAVIKSWSGREREARSRR